MKAEVANFALDEGVAMVNDVSGLDFDPAMAPLVAARAAPLVLMHMRGRRPTCTPKPPTTTWSGR
jgi:dihydropteroate synthase